MVFTFCTKPIRDIYPKIKASLFNSTVSSSIKYVSCHQQVIHVPDFLWELQRSVLQHWLLIMVLVTPKLTDADTHWFVSEQFFITISASSVLPTMNKYTIKKLKDTTESTKSTSPEHESTPTCLTHIGGGFHVATLTEWTLHFLICTLKWSLGYTLVACQGMHWNQTLQLFR